MKRKKNFNANSFDFKPMSKMVLEFRLREHELALFDVNFRSKVEVFTKNLEKSHITCRLTIEHFIFSSSFLSSSFKISFNKSVVESQF